MLNWRPILYYMFDKYRFTARERFLKYVQIDTQSDPDSTSFPSTAKQKDLGRLLVQELLELGISDAHLDEFGYVYGTLESNSDKKVPVICFCSHMDTSFDCSGAGVKPIVHENYQGQPIILPDDPTQVISTDEHPYLLERIGDDIITASGTTLLGADDKAGIAVIIDMVNYFKTNPEVRHGRIKILFTPDEEIGRGVDKVDMVKLGADIGYTLDGGERGAFEDENFSADGAVFTFYGVSAHPGQAKDKMVNALKVAAHFVDLLPKDELSPESTDGRYGFVHPVQMEGVVEKSSVKFILRDFVSSRLAAYAEYLQNKAEEAIAKFPGARYEMKTSEQYRNMKEVLVNHPDVVNFAREAIEKVGCTVRTEPIRGGTDGARLSYLGLPCPNIFTGEMALHGKHEYISVQDMQKSVETIVTLAQLWEQRSN